MSRPAPLTSIETPALGAATRPVGSVQPSAKVITFMRESICSRSLLGIHRRLSNPGPAMMPTATIGSRLAAGCVLHQDKASQLNKVTQFAGTDAAQWARVELALLDEREGQVAKAITQLETINAGLDAKLLKPAAHQAGRTSSRGQAGSRLALYRLSSWESFATEESYRSRGGSA